MCESWDSYKPNKTSWHEKMIKKNRRASELDMYRAKEGRVTLSVPGFYMRFRDYQLINTYSKIFRCPMIME